MQNIGKMIEAYAAGADLLRESVAAADASQIDLRPIPGKWSIREVLCHLADSEIVYADRMKRVLAEDNPTFFEADPNLFLKSLRPEDRQLDQELEVIAVVRRHMLPILSALDSDAFQRGGQHSLDGPMTLATLLQRITDHIPHHAAFIDEKIAALAG